MSRVSSLYRLQQLDIKLSESQSRLLEIQAILDDSGELLRARELVARAEEVVRDAQTVMNRAEHALGTQRSKIESTDGKLYSGRITNPKELQDLQQESVSLKRHMRTLEDRFLEAMLELDEAEAKLEAARAVLAQVEEDRILEHGALTREQADLSSSLERLQAERQVAVASVSDDDLILYDKLRQDLGSVAVALIDETCCSACGLVIPPSVRQVARGDANLVRCGQCGRVLYGG